MVNHMSYRPTIYMCSATGRNSIQSKKQKVLCGQPHHKRNRQQGFPRENIWVRERRALSYIELYIRVTFWL